MRQEVVLFFYSFSQNGGSQLPPLGMMTYQGTRMSSWPPTATRDAWAEDWLTPNAAILTAAADASNRIGRTAERYGAGEHVGSKST